MNYAQLRHFDVANGPGVRASIFVSGCRFNCKGCFNKEAQDFNYGNKFDKETEDKFMEYIKDDNVKGVSILGGEPLMQTMDNSLLNLLKRIKKESNKEIWMWTGFVYETAILDEKRKEILNYVDVLVDGQFDESKKVLNLKFRGSTNQRIIDLDKTRLTGKIIEKTEFYK